jgi:ABC-type lipoprotein release transport system permease subunit
MITDIAWKNVWRNKTRSLIVIAAVTIGVFAGVFTIAVMNSAVVQRIDAAVNEELSHIQINNKDFRSNSDINNVISDCSAVTAMVDTIEGVSSVTGRVIVRGIASTAARSTGVEINGIDVEKEKEIFTLSEKIIPGTGSFFESDSRLTGAVIGEKLAKELNIIRYILSDESIELLKADGIPDPVLIKLEPLKNQRFTTDKKFTEAFSALLTPSEIKRYGMKIKDTAWSYRVGSKLVVSFLDRNNVQTGAAFRVSGIFRTNNDMFEATSIFVPVEDLRRLTGLEEGLFHRLLVRLDESDLTDDLNKKIGADFPDLEVMSWKEIQPDLGMMADMVQQIYAVFMLIILAALSFGIVNTMLMSVLERTRELGMLAAIGMNHRRIFLMIMLESVFLSVLGGIVGMGVGGAVIAATAEKGINLVKYSEGMEAIGYTAHLFPTIDAQFFIITTILIVLTGIISSIYPARKALKLNPADAIRGTNN